MNKKESKQKLAPRDLKTLVVLLFLPAIIPLIVAILIAYLLLTILLHILAWLIWNTRGINTLYVYSNSPHWEKYVEQNILPRLPRKSIVLNWSERKKWKRTLSTLAFRHFGGYRDFNPMALVFLPFHCVKIFRFHQAFKDFKHGRDEPLKKMEAEFFSVLEK